MPKRSSIGKLPAEVKFWLDTALVEGNFTGYQALENLLKDKGYEISKSAIHRYGRQVERRMATIKASTEAARLITESAGDEKDSRSEAILALVQTEIFDALLNLQEATEDDLDPKQRFGMLADAAKGIALLTKSSVDLKKFQQTVKDRIESAANNVEKIAKKGGLSAESVQALRKEILGIAT